MCGNGNEYDFSEKPMPPVRHETVGIDSIWITGPYGPRETPRWSVARSIRGQVVYAPDSSSPAEADRHFVRFVQEVEASDTREIFERVDALELEYMGLIDRLRSEVSPTSSAYEGKHTTAAEGWLGHRAGTRVGSCARCLGDFLGEDKKPSLVNQKLCGNPNAHVPHPWEDPSRTSPSQDLPDFQCPGRSVEAMKPPCGNMAVHRPHLYKPIVGSHHRRGQALVGEQVSCSGFSMKDAMDAARDGRRELSSSDVLGKRVCGNSLPHGGHPMSEIPDLGGPIPDCSGLTQDDHSALVAAAEELAAALMTEG